MLNQVADTLTSLQRYRTLRPLVAEDPSSAEAYVWHAVQTLEKALARANDTSKCLAVHRRAELLLLLLQDVSRAALNRAECL